MKDKYLIGEVCKLFNITRDTLVHYDKIGLLSPKKDDKNGYRYYGIEDINCLMDIMLFKQLNLPLNEINKVVRNSSPSDILALIKEKEIYLQEEMEKVKKLQKRLGLMKLAVETCANDLNKIELKSKKESCFFVEITKENKFNDFVEILEGLKDFDEYLADYVNFSFLIDEGVLFDEEADEKIKWGISLREDCDIKTKSKLHYKLETISNNKYIYTVISLDDNDYDDWIQYIRDIVAKNNIDVAGSILGRMLLTVYKDETPIDYFEVFIPIK